MNALRRLSDAIALWRMQRTTTRRIREMCRCHRTEEAQRPWTFYCVLLPIGGRMSSSGTALLLASPAMARGCSPRSDYGSRRSSTASWRETPPGRRLTLTDINRALDQLGVEAFIPRTR